MMTNQNLKIETRPQAAWTNFDAFTSFSTSFRVSDFADFPVSNFVFALPGFGLKTHARQSTLRQHQS